MKTNFSAVICEKIKELFNNLYDEYKRSGDFSGFWMDLESIVKINGINLDCNKLMYFISTSKLMTDDIRENLFPRKNTKYIMDTENKRKQSKIIVLQNRNFITKVLKKQYYKYKVERPSFYGFYTDLICDLNEDKDIGVDRRNVVAVIEVLGETDKKVKKIVDDIENRLKRISTNEVKEKNKNNDKQLSMNLQKTNNAFNNYLYFDKAMDYDLDF